MSDEIEAAVDRVVFGFRDRDFAALRTAIRRELEAMEQRERALADALGEALEKVLTGNGKTLNLAPIDALAKWKAARDG